MVRVKEKNIQCQQGCEIRPKIQVNGEYETKPDRIEITTVEYVLGVVL